VFSAEFIGEDARWQVIGWSDGQPQEEEGPDRKRKDQ